MRAHFLLWRESYSYADIVSAMTKISEVVYSATCANDFNVMITCEVKNKDYFSLIEKVGKIDGVRKAISFPVTKKIISRQDSVNNILIVLAVRMPKRHSQKEIYRLIQDSSALWSDQVDGIFSYLVCFDSHDDGLLHFLNRLYRFGSFEYVEPLVMLPDKYHV